MGEREREREGEGKRGRGRERERGRERDNQFSERNAEVTCRQLGFSTLNVYLDFEQRIEYRCNIER